MYKELIITILIVTLIFSLDIITNKYTVYATNNLSDDLKDLRYEIKENNDMDKIDSKIDEIFNKWDDYYNGMAYYLEHDELEKVETELTKLRADVQNKRKDDCLNEIDTTIFILKHIEEKEKFTIQNIF